MSILRRNNVQTVGSGGKAMIFAHGFGCDQNMWRLVTPAFAQDYKIILFDHVGSGGSDLSAYDPAKYDSLHGYAADLLEICDALALSDAILVGHSVSAMIGVLAANSHPGVFSQHIMVAPSPCYLNDGGYHGGFSREDLDGLIEFLDANFLGWSQHLAPAIMGVPERPELVLELTNSFCRTDPDIAKHFAKTTFLSDHRADVEGFASPSLILQCSDDIVAPLLVGEWLHSNIPQSTLIVMKAKGHCPHLSAPEETIAAIRSYLE